MSETLHEEDEGREPVLVHRIPAGWWERAFTCTCGDPDCREWTMLMIVAYDIRSPRRLRRVAEHCEDYGARVQFSVFEVRLNADVFDRFWAEIQELIDAEKDRLVAYRVCNECSRKIRAAGTMQLTEEKPVAHVF
jgi:CRISPR-associated protein Cas2